MASRVKLIAAGFVALLTAASVDSVDLQSELDRAAHLNVTAPWEASQQVLDAIEPQMHTATPRQRGQFEFIAARNQALAGDCDAAVSSLQRLRSADSDPDQRLGAYRLSANCALNQGDFEQGFSFLSLGLSLLPEVEASSEKTMILGLATYYHSQAGEPAKALEYAQQAMDLAALDDDQRGLCMALFDLSLAEENAGAIREASVSARSAVDSCKAAQDPVYVGASQVQYGELLSELGDHEGARRAVEAGLGSMQEAGYRDGVMRGQLTLAHILVQLGDSSQATQLLRPLVDEFERMEYWRDLRETLILLATLGAEAGDYEQPYRDLLRAEAANDRYLDGDRAMRLSLLQVQFDTLHKEQEIELLRERNRLLEVQEQAQNERRQLVTWGLFILAVIGAFLFMLLLRTRSDRRHLLWLSEHDGLTGLSNHTTFFNRASVTLEECLSQGRPAVLFVADIDHFKRTNDEHGHACGDEVLRHVGVAMVNTFSRSDIVGRVGGEEFAALLPDHTAVEAKGMIAQFHKRLSEEEGASELPPITLSYGLAEASQGQTLEALRQTADEALYVAKRRGRNQIVEAATLTPAQEVSA